MDAYPLTDQQVDDFRRDGFVQLPNVLEPAELDATRDALEDAFHMPYDPAVHLSQGEYEKVFVQKVNLWTVHSGVRTYVMNPRIAGIAQRLCGAERVRLWHDHALVKMPGDSRPSPWHQDLPYWPMVEAGALSCWMALDDVDVDNGCMQFIPGSHRWGRLEPIRLTDPQDLFALTPDAASRDFTPSVMRMQAGSCTFHDGRTFHYASANSTDRPRRAIVTIFMADGTTYSGARHVVSDRAGLAPGSPFDGPLFPILAP